MAQPTTPQSDSILSGGLAGILAATVFGGPIGAAIGIGTGLMSERMHRNELDILTDDYDAIQKYGDSIQQQITNTAPYLDQVGSPDGADHEQLNSIAEDARRAQEFSTHYDPQIRAAGIQQLTNVGQRLDAFHNSVQARTEHLADQRYEAESALATHFQTEFEKTQDRVRQLNADADQAMYLVNNVGVDTPETKTALMKLLGMTTKEGDQDAVSWNIGLLGTGAGGQMNGFNPTYDEAIKIIESQRATQIKASSDYIQQIVSTAHQAGFEFNTSAEGQVSVRSVNSAVQNFRQMQPSGTAPAPTVPAIKSEGATQMVPALGGGGIPSGPQVMKGVDDATDAVSKFGADAVEQAKAFIHQNVRRKRRTNQ